MTTYSEDQNWYQAASVSELEDREPHPVTLNGEEVAVVLMDNDIYAINNVCTHEYACLSDGFIEEDKIVCQLHLAEFHIPTGRVMEDPAEEDLATYPVAIDGDDIYVQVT